MLIISLNIIYLISSSLKFIITAVLYNNMTQHRGFNLFKMSEKQCYDEKMIINDNSKNFIWSCTLINHEIMIIKPKKKQT